GISIIGDSSGNKIFDNTIMNAQGGINNTAANNMIYANKLINVKSLGIAGGSSGGGANPVSNNNTNNIPMQTSGFNQPASPNNINHGGGNSNGSFSGGALNPQQPQQSGPN
ncbi:MAG: hypothetical protein WBL88_13580, partial [Nitrososphaeraceae archaeon]